MGRNYAVARRSASRDCWELEQSCFFATEISALRAFHSAFDILNSAFASRHGQFIEDVLHDSLFQCPIHRLSRSQICSIRWQELCLDHKREICPSVYRIDADAYYA